MFHFITHKMWEKSRLWYDYKDGHIDKENKKKLNAEAAYLG